MGSPRFDAEATPHGDRGRGGVEDLNPRQPSQGATPDLWVFPPKIWTSEKQNHHQPKPNHHQPKTIINHHQPKIWSSEKANPKPNQNHQPKPEKKSIF